MVPELEILIKREADQYILIAQKYGIVIRATDRQAGLKELEARVEDVQRDMLSAGVDPERQSTEFGRKNSQLGILFAVAVATLLPWIVLFITAAPIFTAINEMTVTVADVRQFLKGDVSQAGRAGINWAVRAGETVDQLTPARKEELQMALRKIVTGISPFIDEFRPLLADPKSQKDKQ